MKKTNYLLCIPACILLLSLWNLSCKKDTHFQNVSQKENSTTVADIGAKDYQNQIFTMYIGHDGKTCPGCIYINGRLLHQDCQGSGNYCQVSANVTLYVGGSDMYAVTTDTFGLTDLDYFNMPARSLLAEDEKGWPVYLNIPAQLVYRDSSTLQFTLTGLYYTPSAVYTND